jgi:hypothetical protein
VPPRIQNRTGRRRTCPDRRRCEHANRSASRNPSRQRDVEPSRRLPVGLGIGADHLDLTGVDQETHGLDHSRRGLVRAGHVRDQLRQTDRSLGQAIEDRRVKICSPFHLAHRGLDAGRRGGAGNDQHENAVELLVLSAGVS